MWAGLWLILLLAGCAASPKPPLPRPFVFGEDTIAYTNELVWEYQFDDVTGETTHHPRSSPPTYSHHCFVVTKSAQQFFLHAHFDPGLPKVDEAGYRKLIRRVVGRDPARELPEEKKTVIPGYANLFAFSQEQEPLLKEECGG
ncbi:MAG TPA: hypothetical protein VLD18_02025, partial [Verrucomicrobiae bacterium]|nr:hypothetical protein [Verrucomicrobiae bacterium]